MVADRNSKTSMVMFQCAWKLMMDELEKLWKNANVTFIVFTQKTKIDELKWSNWRDDQRNRRLQLGCNLDKWDMEIIQSRDLGDSKRTHFFVEKHGVAILLNKKWRYRIVDTDHISERAISTTNKQKFMQMSVCFSHSGYADHVERLLTRSKGVLQIIGGDFNTELDRRRASSGEVLDNRHSENLTKVEIGWNSGWWYAQHDRRLKKQNTYRSAKGTEKQIDYILKKGNTSAWIKTSKQTTWSIWVWKRFEISKSKARVKQQR